MFRLLAGGKGSATGLVAALSSTGFVMSGVVGHAPQADRAREQLRCLRDVRNAHRDAVAFAAAQRGVKYHRYAERKEAEARGLARFRHEIEHRYRDRSQ